MNAFGSVSLAFELFSSCVKGYNLLLEAKDMPKSYRHLLARLQMEKDKLLSWAILAKLSEEEISADSILKINKHTVLETLRQIEMLLLDFSKLDSKIKLTLALSESTNEATPTNAPLRDDQSLIQKRALSFIDKTRRYPKRLQWAVFDKTQFEALLSKLGDLNNTMLSFLEAYDRNRHLQMQEASFMQILQVKNAVGELAGLLRSLKDAAASGSHKHGASDRKLLNSHEERIINLTRFKTVSIAVESENNDVDDSITSLLNESTNGGEIPFESLVLQSDDEEDRPSRSWGTLDGVPVWLEWRYYEEVDEDEGPPPFVAQRISRMAKLLADEKKPSEFLVPKCIGYVHDEDEYRFGFVFGSSQRLGSDLPMSLFEALSTTKKPSLTTRIRIIRMVSTSIWYLHATNWLHKGLRSENVIFQDKNDLKNASPFLCGFDYSRPANIGEETERPTENLWHDLYRHPKTQFDVPRDGRKGFNKLYDIYSLGVLIYEIGVWMPIQKFLGLESLKASSVKDVKSRLLEDENLETLESEVGSIISHAAKTCLEGSLIPDETMTGVESNAVLQFNFGEQVIKNLDSICI